MEHDTAGCPVSGRLWTRTTTEKVARELKAWGISICDRTVAHLLKGLSYALRVNQKTVSGHCAPERNEQFEVIAAKRRCGADVPLISVDTKKKELIGRYRNPGAKWGRKAEQVNDHDFRSLADGLAVPFGIYDLHANAGSFQVGMSYDTPQFAVDCIVRWWLGEGLQRYGKVSEMIILADAGGSNGYRCRAWKFFMQHNFVNRFKIAVTVAHYPSGTSKWNPIEHRLFSEASKQWAGIPLESFETVLQCLRTTRTKTGLTVTADLVEAEYSKGIKISDKQMASLNCVHGDTLPKWNYTIKPEPSHDQGNPTQAESRQKPQ